MKRFNKFLEDNCLIIAGAVCVLVIMIVAIITKC